MNPAKVFSGITLIFFGITLYIISKIPAENVKYGGVVLIGPFPIVFGSDINLMVLTLFIALVVFIISMARRW